MKKLYLAFIFVIFSCLLATVLSVLAYNNSGGGSSGDLDELAKQVDSLIIKTNELESTKTTIIPTEKITNETTEVVKTEAKEVTKAEPITENKEVTPTAEKEQPKTTAVSTKVVTGSTVNMRSEPKTTASLITTLNKGAEVSTDGQTSRDSGITFVKVSYNGKTGWISQDYLK